MTRTDLHALEALVRGRRENPPPDSYSATLLDDPERAARKIVEEAFELSVELMRPTVDTDRVASEAADVVFHLLVGLVGAGVPWDAVLEVLEERRR